MESAHAPVARITPAHAGKRAATGDVKPAARDHPRVRGEKDVLMTPNATEQGSPPHARGKAPEQFRALEEDRITPACAGKSQTRKRSKCPTWDHPRACGEKALSGSLSRIGSGSPPRVRGKAQSDYHWRRHQGITPARAGKR